MPKRRNTTKNNQGDADGQYRLIGWRYEYGEGEEEDGTMAKQYYQMATDQGLQPAKQTLQSWNNFVVNNY